MTEESIVYLKDNRAGKLVQATLVERLRIREIVLTEEQDWRPLIQECCSSAFVVRENYRD